jgi:hypothetical protein
MLLFLSCFPLPLGSKRPAPCPAHASGWQENLTSAQLALALSRYGSNRSAWVRCSVLVAGVKTPAARIDSRPEKVSP